METDDEASHDDLEFELHPATPAEADAEAGHDDPERNHPPAPPVEAVEEKWQDHMLARTYGIYNARCELTSCCERPTPSKHLGVLQCDRHRSKHTGS